MSASSAILSSTNSSLDVFSLPDDSDTPLGDDLRVELETVLDNGKESRTVSAAKENRHRVLLADACSARMPMAHGSHWQAPLLVQVSLCKRLVFAPVDRLDVCVGETCR